VVARDEREAGQRRILNYGHTIGHAVEAYSGYALSHGMAVAIGMVAAAQLAQSEGLLAADAAKRIEDLIAAYGLPTALPEYMETDRLIKYMLTDKKTVKGRITFVLPTAVGEVVVTDQISLSRLRKFLDTYKARA
jgi:3-dehydroquinate synthase